MNKHEKFATQVHKACKQIRKQLDLKGAGWISFNKKENIKAIKEASIKFGVSIEKLKQVLR